MQIEGKILPADARLEDAITQRTAIGDKCQSQIELVLVDRRDARLVNGADILQLREDLPVLVQPDVDMYLQPLQQIRIAARIADAEIRSVVELKSLAQTGT